MFDVHLFQCKHVLHMLNTEHLCWHTTQPGFDGTKIKVPNVQQLHEKLLKFMSDADIHREDLRKGMFL